MENKHDIGDLFQMQSLPLEGKIRLTKERIKAWYEYFDGQVYVAFSGGKDSTVLLDIVRNICGYKDVPAVFVDTGLEYPEIREFVKGFDNVVWLKPKMNFKQVIEKYGYPFISKEVSECVYGARKYLTRLRDEIALTDRQTDRQTDSISIDIITKRSADLANILNERMRNRMGGNNQRLAQVLGWNTKNKENPVQVNAPSEDRSLYSQVKYKFMLSAPFEISNQCCMVMKKEPSHRYAKETGRKVITGQMAEESRLRKQKWLQNGCNGFNTKNPTSNPMAFWTEQDVLQYIKEYSLPICSVYGEIVEDRSGTDEVEGQMTISDVLGFEDCKSFDAKKLPLKTTGCSRTGCMFCGYGCHLEKGEGRFERMKATHPKQYEWIMKPWSDGGLGYKEVIDWLNKNGNLNIKY